MKICLLVCDHVSTEFAETHGAYPQMFQRLLPELKMESYFVCDGQFPDVHAFDAFICTGSSFSVYDDEPWIHRLSTFIQEVERAKKKFIGVCFGHQMVAHALGGKVEKASVGWNIGVHTFEILEQAPWMQPEQAEVNVLMLCQDQVVQLPPNADVLSQAKLCPVGMFRIGSQFLTIQGHPEFTKEYDQAVYQSRSHLIDLPTRDMADESMKKSLSNDIIGRWFLDWLGSE